MADNKEKNQEIGVLDRIKFAVFGEKPDLDASIKTRTWRDGLRNALSTVFPVEDKATLAYQEKPEDAIPKNSILPDVLRSVAESTKIASESNKKIKALDDQELRAAMEASLGKGILSRAEENMDNVAAKEAMKKAQQDKELGDILKSTKKSWVPEIFSDLKDSMSKTEPGAVGGFLKGFAKGFAQGVKDFYSGKPSAGQPAVVKDLLSHIESAKLNTVRADRYAAQMENRSEGEQESVQRWAKTMLYSLGDEFQQRAALGATPAAHVIAARAVTQDMSGIKQGYKGPLPPPLPGARH